MSALVNRTGNRYGRLVVTCRASNSRAGATRWHCVCDCGGETIVSAGHLEKGQMSCGCFRGSRGTHYETTSRGRSREYTTWSGMKVRCYNPNADMYPLYGGRGIKVCDRWLNSFETFLADMGRRPSPKHSIDRINNDGDCEPGNCRWSTYKEQRRNSRGLRWLTWNERTMCMTDWANEYKMPLGRLQSRLNAGWPIGDALTEPTGARRKR